VDVLAIDGGKTKTLIAPYRDGQRGEVSRIGGLENIAAPGGPREIRQVLASVIGPEIPRGPWEAVAIGLTSVHGRTPNADVMLDILEDLVDAKRMIVASDVVTTYCGAVGSEPGAVVAAGTGSIALGLAEGRSARVDGWGYLIGDEGSGFAIGRAGLRAALRRLDGRGGSAALLERAAEYFGSTDGITRTVYGSSLPVATVAAFSAEVAKAALDGDALSQHIWLDAAKSLAEMVVSAARQVTDRPDVRISYSGGLFGAGELLLRPFVAAVKRELPEAAVRDPDGDALDGAALMASAGNLRLLEPVTTSRDGSSGGTLESI
jgi:glucosamine kinase